MPSRGQRRTRVAQRNRKAERLQQAPPASPRIVWSEDPALRGRIWLIEEGEPQPYYAELRSTGRWELFRIDREGMILDFPDFPALDKWVADSDLP